MNNSWLDFPGKRSSGNSWSTNVMQTWPVSCMLIFLHFFSFLYWHVMCSNLRRILYPLQFTYLGWQLLGCLRMMSPLPLEQLQNLQGMLAAIWRFAIFLLSTSQILLIVWTATWTFHSLKSNPKNHKSRRSNWVPNHGISYAVQELSHPSNQIFRHASTCRSSDPILIEQEFRKLPFSSLDLTMCKSQPRKGRRGLMYSYAVWSGAVEWIRERERDSKQLVFTLQTQLYEIRRFIRNPLEGSTS